MIVGEHTDRAANAHRLIVGMIDGRTFARLNGAPTAKGNARRERQRELRDAAIAYAQRGLLVLPLRRGEKRPLLRHGVHDASRDVAVVTEWWSRWPDANIGIVCGAANGIVVIDVDIKNGKKGDESLVALVAKHGAMGDTIQATTASSGSHFYYSIDRALPPSRGLLGPDIDVQGDDTYVVAPPSIVNGARYTWCTGGSLLAMPPWLVALCSPPKTTAPAAKSSGFQLTGRIDAGREEKLVRASAYLANMPPSISGDYGHQALWNAAIACTRGFALDETSAYHLLMREFNPRCQPPWHPGDIIRKVKATAQARDVGLGYLLERTK